MNLTKNFNTYYDKIYSFTLMRVGNVHDTEDIASTVFVKVAEKIHTWIMSSTVMRMVKIF